MASSLTSPIPGASSRNEEYRSVVSIRDRERFEPADPDGAAPGKVV